ncbi:MAG: leucine-rich repeat domain-containing protein [Clostridiales bacterium]|nr:leucine-rich repeat domain-containing protein [Clostridiales bacterium]
MNMKRIIVMMAILVLALFALPGCAEEEILSCNGFEYVVLEDNSCKIVAYKGNADTLEIPEMLDGHIVSVLGGCIFYDGYDNKTLVSVTIPSGVKTIEREAFWNCHALENVVIPEGVASIGENAFGFCKELKTLSIPASVTEITGNPVSGSEKLETIVLSENQTKFQLIDGFLFDTEACALIMCPVDYEESYTIPEGTKIISASAFARCKGIEAVYAPSSLMEVGEYAFAFCNSIRTVEFSEGVEKIGASAFFFCGNIESVKLPESVNEIGDFAFYISPANRWFKLLAKYGSYAYNWAKENNVNVDFYR